MTKSLEKQTKFGQGRYDGLWSGFNVQIFYADGTLSESFKVDKGVKGINVQCVVDVDRNGFITVK